MVGTAAPQTVRSEVPHPEAAPVFKEAWQAAAALPSLLAAREMLTIARDEEIGAPAQALTDFQSLYATVHVWSTGSDTEVQKVTTKLRYGIEAAAIEAFAKQGRFDQAMEWLEVYDPGNTHKANPAAFYSQVLLQMLEQGKFALVVPAIQQCVREGDGFPFEGAATALNASGIEVLERAAIAREGLQAAPGSPRSERNSATFLAEVHTTYPTLDGEVEDAIVALLRAAHDDSAKHPGDAQLYDEGGSRLLALLEQIDPSKADALRARYPAASTGTAGNGLSYTVSGGKLSGASVGRGPVGRLLQMASTDLSGALAGAAKFDDKNQHFAALAGIAAAIVKTHPTQARQAADSADGLLDKDVAFAETGVVADLARTYQELGEPGKAADVAGVALDAADEHTKQIEEQFDISTPEGDAKAVEDMAFPQIGLTYAYNRIATFLPMVALEHAHACKCPIDKGLILAKVAEAMTPAGAKAPY